MHRRAGLLAALTLTGLLGACSTSPQPAPTTDVPTPSTPTGYAEYALDLIGQGLDIGPTWPDVRGVALQRVEVATTTTQTYGALRDALAAGGQSRGDLIGPEDVARVPASVGGPTTTTQAGITLLTVPGFSDLSARLRSGRPTDAERAYVRAGSAAIANAAATTTCGWIVDVRGNSTTDVPVLLGSVAALLPAGPVLGEVDRSGARSQVSLQDDAVVTGESLLMPIDPVSRHEEPVVVLQDRGTSRAAEAVVLAFRARSDSHSIGESTVGDTIDGTTESLSDGALLFVTRWRLTTPGGPATARPVEPDEVVEGTDAQQAAAERWLTSRCGS